MLVFETCIHTAFTRSFPPTHDSSDYLTVQQKPLINLIFKIHFHEIYAYFTGLLASRCSDLVILIKFMQL